MPTYEEEVLADSPLAFWRLKDGAGATVMTNIGSSGVHGTYFPDSVFGFPPPVESDASAAAVGGRVGEGGSTPKPTGNLAMEGWVYCSSAGNSNTLINGIGQFGALGGIFTGYDAGTIVARFDNGSGAGTVDLTYSVPVLNIFYHVVFSRNSAQLDLIVNGVIVDTTSYPNADPITSIYTTNPWRIGVGGTSNLHFGVGTAEPAVYDHPLTDARARAHFEAALNTLSLVGVSNVLSSAVLYSDVEEPPTSLPIRHNWSDPLIERISFKSGISRAMKGYEQANAQRIKPRREIEISQMLKDDTERRMFRAKLNAHQNRKWFIPILEDRERLTSSFASGIQTIPTDTLYKDYEIGSYVGLRQLDNSGRITKWEEALISGLEDDEVQTATPTVNAYTTPEVYPVRRGIINAQSSLRGHTDSVEDTTIIARLIAEDEKAVPHRIIPWTPVTMYKSYEVFDAFKWPNNWSDLREYEVSRDRRDVDFELGSFTVEADSLAADESFTWSILLDSKQKQAEFLGWFYARAGSLNYVWVPTMQRDFAPVSAVSTSLTVQGNNFFDNFAGSEYRRDLTFIYDNSSMEFRRIDGVALDGDNEILDFDLVVPSLVNLRSVSYLRFCRLEVDALEIARVTDTKARFAWRFMEALSSPA